MENKRFYWLKLKEDFFDEDTIAWLEEQPNGETYSLFYLKLCLKSLKNNGVLIRSVGDLLIPYDAEKLAQITRTNVDTVRISMELFKQIGLVQILENGEIYLTQLETMIGSEAGNSNAQRQKRFRERKKLEKLLPVTNSNAISNEDIDIEIDIDKDIDINKEIDNNKLLSTKKERKFVKPTLEEVKQYCEERNNNINPQTFIDFYESKGWKIGSTPMKDWKASVRTWENKQKNNKQEERQLTAREKRDLEFDEYLKRRGSEE